MIKIELNGISYWVANTLTTLEVCNYVGVCLPRFCYHETLSIAGNCRMCLVEVVNSPKPLVACALPVVHNMQIFTATPLVKKAQENIIEVLLLNHPLDCPICDQAGECDLQDQAYAFGSNISTFFLQKRSVEDKFCSPLIKTIMSRCIHCTRCIRFGSEIAGVDFLGTLNRGGSTEIGSYIQTLFKSEISGNAIDLCPVGAITSKKYAFTSRPWELRTFESLDLTDSLGSNIYISYKGTEILKILPKVNLDLNDNLITDKARFATKKVSYNNLSSSLYEKEWISTLNSFKNKTIFSEVLILIDDELDLDSLVLLGKLESANKIKVRTLRKAPRNSNLSVSFLNAKVYELQKKCPKFCLILSSNLKIESAILNIKLRQKVLKENIKTYLFASKYETGFPSFFFNLGINFCLSFLEGKDKFISKFLILFSCPLILIGNALYQRGVSSYTFIQALKKVMPSALIFQIRKYSNTESFNILNFKKISKLDLILSKKIFCLNLKDSIGLAKLLNNLTEKKVTWFNSFCSKLSREVSQTILPINSQFGETSTFLNCEQRPQKSSKLFNSSNNVRSLKFFLKSVILLDTVQYSSLPKRFKYLKVLSFKPWLFKRLELTLISKLVLKSFSKVCISFYPIKASLQDFYLTMGNALDDKQIIQVSQRIRKEKTNFLRV